MKIEEIKDLMNFLEEGKLTKIVLKKGDFELELVKESPKAAISDPSFLPSYIPQKEKPVKETAPKEEAPKEEAKAGTHVTSPMVGTFYGSPSPDQPAFVKVGDRVDENTVICIVEAMKVMNEVKAGMKGVIAEVLIDNSQPVEFGTKMFRIV